jgi:asparagine synthase (glutamine-hydrolysing)
LLKNVFQLGAGEIAYFTDNKVDIISYFQFLPDDKNNDSFEKLADRYVEILEADYRNLINALNGRPVVIPLSGGYDSRSIVTMFKRLGYQNVICYSFGQNGSPEMITSQKVAKTLGYRWSFIETTPEIVKGFTESDEFFRYVDFAANASSFYIIQDFFAVRKMRKEGLVPDDSVFMPGHSGDTLGGSNFLELFSGKESENEMVKKLINYRYDLNKVPDAFLNSARHEIENQYNGNFKPALWFDYWCMKEWNPKMFANGVRVYEFFGYSYWLPLWGKNPLAFFANVPFEFRLGKDLYEYALETKIFEPLGVNFSPKRRLRFSNKTSPLQMVKNFVKQIFPQSYIYRKFRYDPINAKLYTQEMYNSMKSQGKKINYIGTNSVKAQWYIRFLENKAERSYLD